MNRQDTKKNGKQVRIVAICGSLREGSYTRQALSTALEGAKKEGAETQLIELRDYELVFYGMTDEKDFPQDVFRLRRDVQQAQGILLGSPEYHGGLSGVLKNALDLMSFDEIEGKVIGLVGVSGGSMGALNALNSLRTISRNLHAWVLPQQVSIPEAHKYFDVRGNLTDSSIEKRLWEVGQKATQFAKLLELHKDKEFIKMWEGLPFNPGGRKK